MEFNLFQQLFTRIDTATATFANDVSRRAITTAMPFITASLTLMFIFYGLLVARGGVDASIKDFVFKCLKIGIIVSIATSGGLYQSNIADAIQKTPDEFAMALLPTQASQIVGSAAADLVDKAAGAGFAKANEAFANSGVFTKQGLAYVAFGVLCVLATALLTAIGGAFILLTKVALALLAALGPIFILALLFKSTTRFFEAWCAQLVTYGLLVVMVSSVFGLMMQIFTTYMNNVTFDGNLNFAGTLGGCLILVAACVLTVIQIPTIAGGLANSVGVGLWHELRVASGSAAGAVLGAAGQSVIAGRAGIAGQAASFAANQALGLFRGSLRAGA